MLLLGLEFELVTDATVATRTPYLYLRLAGGAVKTFKSAAGLAITASQTKEQTFCANSLIVAAGTQYGMHFPLMDLPAGAIIQIDIGNIQAGDDSTAATYFYKEAPA